LGWVEYSEKARRMSRKIDHKIWQGPLLAFDRQLGRVHASMCGNTITPPDDPPAKAQIESSREVFEK